MKWKWVVLLAVIVCLGSGCERRKPQTEENPPPPITINILPPPLELPSSVRSLKVARAVKWVGAGLPGISSPQWVVEIDLTLDYPWPVAGFEILRRGKSAFPSMSVSLCPDDKRIGDVKIRGAFLTDPSLDPEWAQAGNLTIRAELDEKKLPVALREALPEAKQELSLAPGDSVVVSVQEFGTMPVTLELTKDDNDQYLWQLTGAVPEKLAASKNWKLVFFEGEDYGSSVGRTNSTADSLYFVIIVIETPIERTRGWGTSDDGWRLTMDVPAECAKLNLGAYCVRVPLIVLHDVPVGW